MKASKVVNIILVFFTGVIFLTPVLLRFPLFESGISLLLMTLKIPEYKSAYLGLIGSLVGSWTAITGAIWVQQEIEKANNLQKKKNIKMLCRSFLWNEIRHNHRQMDKWLLKNIHDAANMSFPERSFRLENWYEIRNMVASEDPECAYKIMVLYDYFECLRDYKENVRVIKERSGLDFDKYTEVYNEVTDYLEIKR